MTIPVHSLGGKKLFRFVQPSDQHGNAPKPSLRRAIDEKCRSCTYDPLSGLGTWRQQVGSCHISDCPLHSVRPQPRTGKGGVP
jgi:hypothetical protein